MGIVTKPLGGKALPKHAAQHRPKVFCGAEILGFRKVQLDNDELFLFFPKLLDPQALEMLHPKTK